MLERPYLRIPSNRLTVRNLFLVETLWESGTSTAQRKKILQRQVQQITQCKQEQRKLPSTTNAETLNPYGLLRSFSLLQQRPHNPMPSNRLKPPKINSCCICLGSNAKEVLLPFRYKVWNICRILMTSGSDKSSPSNRSHGSHGEYSPR